MIHSASPSSHKQWFDIQKWVQCTMHNAGNDQKDGRTDNMCDNSYHNCPWRWSGLVDQYWMFMYTYTSSFYETKVYILKTDVINDPLSQTHNSASSDQYFRLNFVLFCQILKSVTTWWGNSDHYTGRDRGWTEWIKSEINTFKHAHPITNAPRADLSHSVHWIFPHAVCIPPPGAYEWNGTKWIMT